MSHHQKIQYHKGVTDDRCDVADLQNTVPDPAAAEPVYDDHKKVDKQERQAIQVGKPTVGLDRGGCITGKRLAHALFFPLFVVKGTHYTNACDVFQ